METKLSNELAWRGFVNQHTFSTLEDVDEPRTFYFGVDPSADSMQVGNLAAAMLVRHFIDHGHRAILLVGGATGMIGDPDGKKQERDLRESDTVNRNVAALTTQFRQVFDGKDFEIVNNADWFADVNYIEFLHQVGKHVSMTQLLDRDFIQARIGEGGSGISYAEFSYALIQGYDFLHLYRDKGVTLQLAGADQWGNSVTGVSLIRKLEAAEAHVLTAPLIVNRQTGVKFGKSEGGAVWLDANKTSPYRFYQFWLNVDDETAEDLIKIYTLLDQATIEALIDNHRQNPAARALQKTLAREVTTLIHGRERCQSVERVTGVLFAGAEFADLAANDIDELAAEIPVVGPQSVISALVSGKLAASNGEARRLITAGAVSVNGQKISEDYDITEVSLVKKGKNAFLLVR